MLVELALSGFAYPWDQVPRVRPSPRWWWGSTACALPMHDLSPATIGELVEAFAQPSPREQSVRDALAKRAAGGDKPSAEMLAALEAGAELVELPEGAPADSEWL